MEFDVIIPSYAKDDTLRQMTAASLETLFTSTASDVIRFHAVVMEQNKAVVYDVPTQGHNLITVHYDYPFNYNKVINHGISLTGSHYVIWSNNDVIFHDHFAEKLLAVFNMGYLSVSPYCPISHRKHYDAGDHIYKGNITGKTVPGWCIAAKRSIFDKIGKLNEDVEFFYSDNIYVEQLNKAEITHALVCNSFVTHLDGGSKTFATLEPKEHERMGWGQRNNFKVAKEKIYAKG
jgi:hypothetical protein